MTKIIKTCQSLDNRNIKKVTIPAINEAQNSLERTLDNLATSRDGLNQTEAKARLLRDGANEVAQDKTPAAFIQLIKAFNNPFIYVLFTLAMISFYTDFWIPFKAGDKTDLTEVIIVITLALISGLMSFWQEYRSAKAALALKALVRTTATVLRRNKENANPKLQEISMKDIVLGDIVQLSAGDMIPADVRLIESRDLFISQAVLTGESIPIEKYDTLSHVQQKTTDTAISSDDCDLLDLPNICFMGTNVVSGTATAVVVATGANTYFGSLAKSIVGSRTQTAFDRGVNSVSWLLIRFMLIMVPVVFFINGFSKGDWTEAFMFALAVAVGLTPEMLPMIVSANLAKGAIAMSRRKVVVKRLNAIQNFGAMDVLCTDKTGTLTQDKIILERHVDIEGNNQDKILELAWLNSYHQSGVKNLMDKAIVRFAKQHPEFRKPKEWHKIDELPFDFVRRRLSVIVESQQQRLLVCKGAVEEMLAVTTHVRINDQIVELTTPHRQKLLSLADQYNNDGFRVLILATRILDENDQRKEYKVSDEADLIVEGFLTFLDPPKDSANAAITALQENGVAVKVLTGDNPIITSKICREVGLEGGTPLLGRTIDTLTDEELLKQVEEHSIFAKLTPLQKSRVLKALQSNGHTVGFLGDGINDAPALKDADVGISVDTGTDIAKESADIILLEKNLMVLEEGVIKGRETFGNIMKYLNMTASSNFGNVFSVLVASITLPFLPMLAIHLLIQNLLYDISQLSLPWDRMDKEFLCKPKKWDAKNIGRFMLWIGPTSSIFDITTFAVMWYIFAANTPELQSLFQSGWFIEGLLSQTLVVHMLRTQKIPFIQSTAAFPVLFMTGLVMVIGIYIPFSPLGTIIGLQPLPWTYFPWLGAILICYCLVAQGMKTFYIRRFGQWY